MQTIWSYISRTNYTRRCLTYGNLFKIQHTKNVLYKSCLDYFQPSVTPGYTKSEFCYFEYLYIIVFFDSLWNFHMTYLLTIHMV